MSGTKVALLFPGQGACYGGVLGEAAGVFPEVTSVFADINAVATPRLGHRVTDLLWGARPAAVEELLAEHPAALQLAIYGTSVAVFNVLASAGLRPDVLVGHSFGEIAALVCGGGFTVAEGAEIVCERTEASRLLAGDGYMAALGADRATAAALVRQAAADPHAAGETVVIASENGARQTVVAGSPSGMDRLRDMARMLNLAFVKLNSPHPFHSTLMEPARGELGRRLQRFTQRPLGVSVFSPIASRYYRPSDRFPEALADHLVRPVRFEHAIRRLHAEGVRVFVECGALNALTRLAGRAAPGADVFPIACLPRARDEVASLRRAKTTLEELRLLCGIGAREGVGFPMVSSACGSFA
jgi:acyl transferase domain-containing protein